MSKLTVHSEHDQTFRADPLPVAGGPGDADAYLVFIYPTGPLMGTRYRLDGPRAVIGRTDDCEVRNTDGSVSRAHARVDRTAGGYVVTDLGSTNGTFVNNVRQKQAPLADGDYLRVGNCIYRFLAGGNIEREYHEEIYRLTVLDGLTQLPNRRFLNEFLDRELARSVRHRRPLAVVLFDLDKFKVINDRYGHLGGDHVLREVAAVAREQVRGDELLARYGGEEFVLVLPEATVEQSLAAGERLRQRVAAHEFVYNGERIPVTVSGGAAGTDGHPDTTRDGLLAAADANLYAAKAGGRNRVVG